MSASLLRRLSLAACAVLVGLAVPARAEPAEAVTMAVPAVSLSFTLGYLAEDLGFFAAQGLAVKQIEIQGLGAINSVISGSSDFAEPSAASVTRAAARGQRLLAIVELTERPFAQLVARKDVAAAAGFDPAAPLAQRGLFLKGRTIGVDSINSVNHAYLRLIAIGSGLDPEDVRIAVLAPANMLAAFETKQIDGFVMTPPWPLKPVLDGTGTMIASGPDGDPPNLLPFAQTVLATRPELCEKRPATCAKMGHAFAAAASAVKDHPDEALAVLEKRFTTLDPKLMAVAFAVLRKITPSPPAVSAIALEHAEAYNIQAGLMKPEEKLKSYDDLFTDKYVR